MLDLLGDGVTMPSSWVFIAPFAIALLTSMSVKDVVPTDPASLEKLKPRARKLRLMVAGLLSLVVVIGQQVTGDVDATLGGLVLTGVIAFRGSGGVADVLKHLGIDLNGLVLPDKGIDPERVLIVSRSGPAPREPRPKLEWQEPEPRPDVDGGDWVDSFRRAVASTTDDPYRPKPTTDPRDTNSHFWSEG
jgi:hypothetical protein